MAVVFSSPYGLVVSRTVDGEYSWSGQYNGIAIRRAVPTGGGQDCVLLLNPDASDVSAFENLVCVDRKGSRVWTAKLPTSPDVFLDLTVAPEGLLAKTWSGLSIVLDPSTGGELTRNFAK